MLWRPADLGLGTCHRSMPTPPQPERVRTLPRRRATSVRTCRTRGSSSVAPRFDLHELRRGARPSLGEHARGWRRPPGPPDSRARRGARRETGEVGSRLGDPERNLGGALERRSKCLIPVALRHLARDGAGAPWRLCRRLGVGLGEWRDAGPERLRLADAPRRPPASGPSKRARPWSRARPPSRRRPRPPTRRGRGTCLRACRESRSSGASRRSSATIAADSLGELGGEPRANCFGERRIRLVAGVGERALEVGDQRVAERPIRACALDDVVEPAASERDLLRSLAPTPRAGLGSVRRRSAKVSSL